MIYMLQKQRKNMAAILLQVIKTCLVETTLIWLSMHRCTRDCTLKGIYYVNKNDSNRTVAHVCV